MRLHLAGLPAALVAAALISACGSSSSPPPPVVPDAGLPGTSTDAGTPPVGGGGTPTDGGTTPTDGGTTPTDGGTTPTDGGTTPTDGGTTPTDGGTTPTDGGTTPTDGGTTASECDGLTPAAPGAPVIFSVVPQDSINDACLPADTDGTGVAAFSWENSLQPHNTHVTLVNLGTNTSGGAYDGVRYTAMGQASGFLGSNRVGAMAATYVTKINDNGTVAHQTDTFTGGFGPEANDPTGGMVLLHANDGSALLPTYLDAYDAGGNIRWSRLLPDSTFVQRDVVGVDRAGNILVLWDGSGRYGGSALAGQWYTPAGSPGPVFNAGSTSTFGTSYETRLFERVGSGLFLWVNTFSAGAAPHSAWVAEYPAGVEGFNAAPAWLQARPQTRLHMVHGGGGYAMLPQGRAVSSCSQTIEVVAPSGTSCGQAAFPVDAAASCQTLSIDVGYDGTVIQQLPTAMEGCTNPHGCTCTWRHWNGFFR